MAAICRSSTNGEECDDRDDEELVLKHLAVCASCTRVADVARGFPVCDLVVVVERWRVHAFITGLVTNLLEFVPANLWICLLGSPSESLQLLGSVRI